MDSSHYGKSIAHRDNFRGWLKEIVLKHNVENCLALISDSEKITYGVLLEKIQEIATSLDQRLSHLSVEGVTDKVLLHCDISIENTIASLAIVESGRAYVPSTNAYPPDRITAIVEDVKPCCIVTTQQDENIKFLQTLAEYKKIPLLFYEDLVTNDSQHVERRSNPENLFCVLYTSGSTGTPKGVRLLHRSVCNRIAWHMRTLPMEPGDVGCQRTSPVFVDSITYGLPTLIQTRPLVIIPSDVVSDPRRFLDVCERHHITDLVLTPTILRYLLNHLAADARHYKLQWRRLTSCGETLTPELALNFFKTLTLKDVPCLERAMLINLYGSTEMTGDVTFYIFENSSDVDRITVNGRLPIGKPIDNSILTIVDEEGNVCSEKVVGNLLVGGNVLFDRYQGSTSEKSDIIKFKFSKNDKWEKMFRSGDRAFCLNGMYYFTERNESVVKVRGNRIDVNEINKIFTGDKRIESVVTLGVEREGHETILVTFYKTFDAVTISKDIFLKLCKEKLPNYMVPRMIQLEMFPILPISGKIDVQTLIQNFISTVSFDHDLIETSSSLETVLINIVSENIGVARNSVSLKDNFFELGGSSTSSLKTIADLSQIGFNISVEDFLRAHNFQEIVDALRLTCSSDKESLCIIEEINEHVQGEFVTKLAQSFFKHDKISRSLGISLEELMDYFNSIYPLFLKDGLSIVAYKNGDKKEVVGGSLVSFSELPIETSSDTIKQVHCLLGLCAEPITKEITESDLWADCFIDFADPNLSAAERAQVLIDLGERKLALLKQKKFTGVSTIDTHTFTIEMDERHFGYVEKNKIRLNTYEEDGRLIFSDEPNSSFIKLLVKRF